MEAKRYLQDGRASRCPPTSSRTGPSCPSRSTLTLFIQDPRGQARNAAQYLRDVMDHYGTEQVPHPTGKVRRFKVFDVPAGERDGRVAGQEEVQNAIYRLLGNFVRAGRINKLILLHGPNGSAKSTLVDALKRGHGGLLAPARGRALPLQLDLPLREAGQGLHRLRRARGPGGTERRARHLRAPGGRDHRRADPLRAAATTRSSLVPRARAPEAAGVGAEEEGLGNGDGRRRTSSSPTTCCDGELCHKCRQHLHGAAGLLRRATTSRCCATCRSSASTSRAATRWAR